MEKHLVILSGGMDSAVVLSLVNHVQVGDGIETVSFDYGQRHTTELEAAKRISRQFRVNHTILGIRLGTQGVLMDHDAEMPHATYEELHEAEGPSPTYVPFRNGSFLSLATSFAIAWDFNYLWAGMHAEDAHNFAYPDCTPEFIGAMQNAIYVGSYHKVRLQVPFQYASKAEIVRVGMQLRTPFELTLSCYEGRRPACGKCPTCIGRLHAFEAAGFEDPLDYETKEIVHGSAS